MLQEKDDRIKDLNKQIGFYQKREVEWTNEKKEWTNEWINERKELMKQNLKQLSRKNL